MYQARRTKTCTGWDIPAPRSTMQMGRPFSRGSPERPPPAVPAVRQLTRRSPRGLPLNGSHRDTRFVSLCD